MAPIDINAIPAAIKPHDDDEDNNILDQHDNNNDVSDQHDNDSDNNDNDNDNALVRFFYRFHTAPTDLCSILYSLFESTRLSLTGSRQPKQASRKVRQY